MSAADVWMPAYIGLGSNLDDPPRQIRQAFQDLASLPRTRLIAVSNLYENPPVGEIEQPDFVNAAAGLLTGLGVIELFQKLKDIETAHGRDRGATGKWGPRPLDLDLLAFGSTALQLPELTVPHAGIAGRNFVLWPLFEVAPGLDLPGLGNVRELALALGTAGLKKIN
jgi:2-amino-4-hydroxy-6-hydroxymethyldihydropteridine diphosphokinase